MCFTFYFQKAHLIFIFYFFIEISKRLMKDQQNKLFSDNSFRNLQMFSSHIMSIFFYLIQKKNLKKEINEKNESLIINYHKNVLNNNKEEEKKDIRKNILLLIILSSILHIISYFPYREYDIINTRFINLTNTYGLFSIISFFIEKKMLKSKFFTHHILSIIILFIISFLTIYNEINEYTYNDIFEVLFNLFFYSIFHYLTLALIFNIYYFINKNYFISLYYISGIQGLISFIITIILIIIYKFLLKESHIIKIYNNTKLNEYIWPFLIFICMTLQNILYILILYFFKPSFICITYADLPLLHLILKIIKLIFYKDFEWKDKSSTILFQIIIIILSLFSVLVYTEILVLKFCGFDKNVKEKIKVRSDIEKNDLDGLEINESRDSCSRDSFT